MTRTAYALAAAAASMPVSALAQVHMHEYTAFDHRIILEGPLRPVVPGVEVGGFGPIACYDPASPPPYEQMLRLEQRGLIEEGPYGNRYFLSGAQWGVQGQPTTITWSFIPDGVSIPGDPDVGDPTAPSNLFAIMDQKFGAANRQVWIDTFQSCFDRWSALTGITFQRVTSGANPWDDGAVFSSQAGAARGTIRIGSHPFTGSGGVLAYAYYPGASGTTGNMVLDSAENWGSSSNSYRYMRNIVMHELGHAIGLRHVCPAVGTNLMEPFINTGFDGPQHDDIRGGQWLYADPNEPNETPATATFMGIATVGNTISPSTTEPAVTQGSRTSCVTGDVDCFKGIAFGNMLATITMTPLGRSESLNQQGESSCVAAPAATNSRNMGDLWIEVVGSNGTAVWAQQFSAGLGGAETVTGILLPGGDFYVRVLPLGTVNQNQAYSLTVRGDSQPTLAASDNAFPSTIRLTWTNLPLANSFRIYRNTTNTRATAALRATADGALTQFDDSTVAAGTTYYYWIEAEQNFSGYVTMAGPSTGQAGLIPSNNNCASATTLNVGQPLNGSTTLATNDGSATCGSSATSKDVWYNFTAPCTGTSRISTCGTNDTGGTDAGMDTVVSVYSGCPGTNANQIACNDDATAGICTGSDTGLMRDSAVQFSTVAGQTYKVRVAGFNNTAGNFTILASYLPPSNDLCAAAISIGDGQYSYGTCGAQTDGPAEPVVGNFFGYNQVGADIWYRYSPACDGTATINLCNSAYDSKVAVYAGSCPSNAGTAIACNDDSAQCGNTRSFLQFACSHNQQYLIRIGGYLASTGSGVMTVGCEGACGSQDFNGDGDFGTDQDIEAFFACLGGNCCATCGLADFNGDGDVGTDQDIEAFFRVLGGGTC